ncbi:MAG: carbohydrate ABC transporter permease [Gemmataceae bacterium]|nr:carbohydrate ABC transporter permease [Gemmataceae bacterium]
MTAIAMRRRRPWQHQALFGVEVVLLAAGAAILLLPYIWMIGSSFKSQEELFRLPLTWLPDVFRWENYPKAMTRFAFPTYIANSMLIATVVTLSNLLFCSMAGYALTTQRFRGREAVFLLLLSTLMLPPEVVLVPQFLVVRALGWLNTYQGLIVPTALDVFGIFLMRQFLLGFPRELIEAARMDGAGEFLIYRRIVLPNIKPALAALAIFSFRDSWDLYIWPLVIVSRDWLKTFPIGVAQFDSEAIGAYNEQMAIAVIGMIPMILLFMVSQKAFVQGIVISGLKE